MAWLCPRQGAPVVEGSLFILPPPQRRVAPVSGGPGQLCLAASLVPAGREIGQLVRHNLWSSRSPVHGNSGHVMLGCF